ncbi:MAG: hypothetical protein HY685_03095 [Chloroflexi bacterium]|nr:hypothetical protein [Chloroflexota bacterium]
MRKPDPDMGKVHRLMRLYIRGVASQAVFQFTIIFIMAKFVSGMWQGYGLRASSRTGTALNDEEPGGERAAVPVGV